MKREGYVALILAAFLGLTGAADAEASGITGAGGNELKESGELTMTAAQNISAVSKSQREKDRKAVLDAVRKMAKTYGATGELHTPEIRECLEEIRSIDEAAAANWESIMGLWYEADAICGFQDDTVPDDLLDTEALCFVVLGFHLGPNGAMRDELVGRLQVALACAEKYPSAYIACTGGPTASGDPKATEAGKMAEWLEANGIARERIIVEDRSLTTAQNALYTFEILRKQYPEVNHLEVITSDYHVPAGYLLFAAEAILSENAESERMIVRPGAAWQTKGTLTRMFEANQLIAMASEGPLIPQDNEEDR